jgi:hypothetical protein
MMDDGVEKETGKGEKTGRRVIGGIILFGIAELAFIKWLFPAYYTPALLFIPAYFLILGIILLLFMARIRQKAHRPGQELTMMIALNGAQMTLSFIVLFCYYYFTDGEQKITMLIAFCCFYLFYMVLKFYVLNNVRSSRKAEDKDTPL